MEVLETRNQSLELVKNDRLEIEIYVDGMYSRTMSGDVIIEAFLSTLNSEHTVRVYKRSIYDFFGFLYPNMSLTAKMLIIDPVHAMAYREELMKQLNDGEMKSATFNAKIKGCRQFYDWLIKQTTSNTLKLSVFKINPFDTVKQVAENDAEGSEPLSPEEVLLMIDNPVGESEHVQTRNRLMLELAISTGIRCEALITMKESNIINIGGDWVISTIDKNKKNPMKPINRYYDQLMEWYKADKKIRFNDNETIFNIHPQSANRIVKDWAKKCGIDKKITFHSLRTTTACQIYHIYDENAGRAKAVLQHTHLETTDKYLKKENKINHDAENIIDIMRDSTTTFEQLINGMNKEQLVELFLSLDTTTKMQIIKKLDI